MQPTESNEEQTIKNFLGKILKNFPVWLDRIFLFFH